MGGSSKFSFSLPGRKPRTQKDAVVDTPPSSSYSTLSKAERLLGTSGLAGQSPQLRPLQSQSLNSRPSYRSLAMSELSIGNASEVEKRSNSTIRHVPNQRSLSRGLRSQASSDVLGMGEDPTLAESTTSRTTGQLRPQESSSTLKSYYDPKKSPLAISQQTSDSAIRDMALRKGQPPVIRTIPNTHAFAPAPNTLGESGPEDAEPGESANRKRRPTRLDISRLFPKPSFSSLHLLSPTKYVESPPQLSATTEYFPHNYASSVRSKTSASSTTQSFRSGNKPSKILSTDRKPPLKASAHKPQVAQSRDEVGVFKSNVRKPPRGIQYWFDGLLEEEDEDDLEGEAITALPPLPAPARGRDLEVDSKIDEPHTKPVGKSFRPQRLSLSPRYPLSSHPVLDATERPTSSTHRHSIKSHNSGNTSRSRSSKLASSNLCESSVISSSSDDETEPEESETHLPRVRDSIALPDVGETILIGKAQAFEVKPRSNGVGDSPSERRPSVSSSILSSVTQSSKPSSIGSGAFLAVPPPFQVKKTRHTRQPSSIPEDENENHRSSSATLRSANQPTKAFEGESHKLMAVTAEEEILLEMMRRKRAAMAKHSFAEGYRTALKQETKRVSTPPRNRFPSSRSSSGQALALQRSKRPPSLIDSFPISNSQRSSLILAASLPSPPPTSALPDPPIEPPSKRSNRLSQHTVVSAISATSAHAKSLSQLSSVSAISIDDRLDRNITPNTTPPTTLSLLDVNIPGHPAKQNHSPTLSSGSQTSPLPSPMTPKTRRGSADVNVLIKHSNSTRDSGASSAALDAAEQSLIDEVQLHAAIDDKARRHSHRRTASSTAHIVLAESEESDEPQRPVTAPSQPPTEKTKRKTSLRLNISPCSHESCVDRTPWRQSGFGPLTSCSVSEDVLAAWTELGGWRAFDYCNASSL